MLTSSFKREGIEMKREICPFCGHKAMAHKTLPMAYTYKGVSIELDQPGRYCSECEESILDAKDLKATRQALASFRAEIDCLLSPEKIREIRKRLKLTQLKAAAICGGGKNAFSRYESGELLIPRAASNLLKVLDKDKTLMCEVETERFAA